MRFGRSIIQSFNHFFRDSRGFTLAEMLVVVSVIAILTASSAVALNGSLKRARDNRRVADIQSINTALELYYRDNEKYPGESYCDSSIGSCTHACPCTGVEIVGNWGSSPIVNALVPKYLERMPLDPINDTNHYYYYEPVGAVGAYGTAGSNSISGTFACGSNLYCTVSPLCQFTVRAFTESDGDYHNSQCNDTSGNHADCIKVCSTGY